ncbi:MAG: glutaredoxin family protein [Gammaproteobacteria bacterium]|nr:glutaredoxin family protein [Gammaproteobacteria bacterium]
MDNLFAVTHLILYTTSACSACEEALERILALGDPGVRTLVTRDVADDERLFERYATRVPVLSYRGTELDWPFGECDMRRLLHGG